MCEGCVEKPLYLLIAEWMMAENRWVIAREISIHFDIEHSKLIPKRVQDKGPVIRCSEAHRSTTQKLADAACGWGSKDNTQEKLDTTPVTPE